MSKELAKADAPRHVRVLLLGGTIACFINEKGESTVVNIADYVKTFHALDDAVRISVKSFSRLDGYETKITDLVNVSKELKRTLREDAVDGIVVVMGTNVMEEAAFSINLLIRTDTPIVFTGAMRIPEARSADGAGNLVSAIAAAASGACRELGAIVVFNDEIHSADYVRKLHPLNLGAFGSEFPLGYIAEGTPSVRTRPVRRLMPWLEVKTPPKDVLLYSSYLGDTGKLLDCVEAMGYDGVVVEGTGGGSVAEWVFERLERIHARMPVVMATRIGAGDVMTGTYGNDYGMPRYCIEHGYLMAGQLDGRKARLLLTFLLISECTPEQIAESFRMYSKAYIPGAGGK